MSDTREIHLPSGHIALINEEHWELAKPYAWCALDLARNRGIYVQAPIYLPGGHCQTISLHRLITGAMPGQFVDHVNHDGLDNRWPENLRICTPSQNNANQRVRSNNTSGYKGVSLHKSTGKWKARLKAYGRERHLGCFDDPWEAAQAYNVAAIEAFGTFALLNERQLTAREIVAQQNELQLWAARRDTERRELNTTNSSGYKGVCWHRRTNKWMAQAGGRYLGVFDDPWEAAQAYNVAASAAWGESAYINERHPDPAEQVSA